MRKLLLTLGLFLSLHTVIYSQLVNFSSIPKEGTILIFTHQDDDLIWMLPWWDKSEKFIGAAMPTTPGFQEVIHKQQQCLEDHGNSADYEANWINPWGLITDVEYDKYYWQNNAAYQYLEKDHVKAFWSNDSTALIRRQIDKIKAKIEQYIADPSVKRIIAHNIWGEYGHQQHKAVNRAVRELAVKYRKDLWMLGVNNNNFQDVYIPSGLEYTMGNYDGNLYNAIRYIYLMYNWWTWIYYTPSGNHEYIKIIDSGNDLTGLYNGETVTVPGPPQYEPGSYIFDGTDDFMTLPGNKSTEFTIAMRIRPDVIKAMDITKMAEYPKSATYDRSFCLQNDGRITASINDGQTKTVTSTSSLSAGNWTHVLMTGDGSTLKIYINGLLEGSINTGSAISSYSSPEFILGQSGITSSFFKGQISDVKLYDYPLTDQDILALSGGTAPPSYTITSNTSTGGIVDPLGVSTLSAGSSKTYHISASDGYQISDVFVDNVSVGSVTSYSFNNINSNHTITIIPSLLSSSIALHKRTTCQSFNTEGESDRANDSDHSNDSHWSAGPYPQWWKVDLGNVYDITYIVIRNYVGNSRYYHYDIMASTDDINYTKIAEKSNNNIANDAGDNYTLTTYARYLKVNVTFCSNNSGAHISDFRVYGTLRSGENVFSINALAGAGGVISPSGSTSVSPGSDKTYSITPNASFVISDVLVDNISIGAVQNYTFTNVSADHTIKAVFSAVSPSIALNKPSSSQSFETGHDASQANDSDPSNSSYWAASPWPQWWQVDLGDLYDINTIIIRNYVDGYRNYQYNIQASTDNVNFTTVATKTNSNIATDAGDNYSVNVKARYLKVNLTANSANSGVHITDFRVYGTLSGVITTYSITSGAGTGGSISPSGTTTVNQGENQTYTLTPNTGYTVTNVKIDNVSIGAVNTYTFSNVTANHTISATFDVPSVSHTISSSSADYGTISPLGTSLVSDGGSITYTITPNSGYIVANVLVDGVSSGAITTYTFSNVKTDHTIEVESFFLATPNYGIDYYSERTSTLVLSTDEYSVNSDMSDAISGSGQKIHLTPGTDVYFRSKARNGMPASGIQHLIVPERPDSPTVSIDYFNERTMEDIESDVEYSTSSSYTNAISGTGTKVYLTPGENLYFQVKATGNSFFSFDTYLVVPERPEAPSVTIDYPNERTMENIGAEIEYSVSSSYANAKSGTGTKVTLTPGQDLYFQIKATSHSFYSGDTYLMVPGRPAAPTVSIDFANERTFEDIGSDIIYSTSSLFSNPLAGTGNKVSLSPGQDLYFKVNATGHSFNSPVSYLNVQPRPPAPVITIDYHNEKTSPLPSNSVWSADSSMTSAVSGGDTAISVTPGKNLYISHKAGSGSFSSDILSLRVPERPLTPHFNINYRKFRTSQKVPSYVEYSIHPDMSGPANSVDEALNVIPGTDLYFRIKSTDTSFRSETSLLAVKTQPKAPEMHVDYMNEKTQESVDSTVEYSTSDDFLSSFSGSGYPVQLNPGESLYFRIKATDSTFNSLIDQLYVSQRPFLQYVGKDTIDIAIFELSASFDESVTDFDLSDISVINGHARNLHGDNLFDVVPENKGEVQVTIPYNSSDNKYFASNTISVYYKGIETGLIDSKMKELSIYPVPSKDGIINIKTSIPKYKIEVLTMQGELVREFIVNNVGVQTIDLEDVKGVYFLRITAGQAQEVRKIILY